MKNLKKLAVIALALIMVVSVFAACDLKITPQQKILGAWRDSTGTMGYEFLDNNACKITYADVTIPISSGNGTSTVFGNKIHVIGGSNQTQHLTFDGITWTALNSVPFSCYRNAAVLFNGRIHLIGGDSTSTNARKHYMWTSLTAAFADSAGSAFAGFSALGAGFSAFSAFSVFSTFAGFSSATGAAAGSSFFNLEGICVLPSR